MENLGWLLAAIRLTAVKLLVHAARGWLVTHGGLRTAPCLRREIRFAFLEMRQRWVPLLVHAGEHLLCAHRLGLGLHEIHEKLRIAIRLGPAGTLAGSLLALAFNQVLQKLVLVGGRLVRHDWTRRVYILGLLGTRIMTLFWRAKLSIPARGTNRPGWGQLVRWPLLLLLLSPWR